MIEVKLTLCLLSESPCHHICVSIFLQDDKRAGHWYLNQTYELVSERENALKHCCVWSGFLNQFAS